MRPANAASHQTPRRNRIRGAIVMPINAMLYRNCMRAISRYASEGQRWEIGVFDSYDFDPSRLIAWKPDAMLVRAADWVLPSLRAMGVPMVTISMDVALPDAPNVSVDDQQIGRIGAEHFLDRHFRHLAFLGAQRQWAQWRFDGFRQAARLAGVSEPAHKQLAQDADAHDITAWLMTLPKPLGLMVCHDHLAVRVLDICASAGIAVPQDVAVLGVDNFEYECDLTNPPLSSVINPLESVSQEAFRTLERLHAGAAVPCTTIRIPSPGIVTRRSTDTTALQDPDLAIALEVIRANLEGSISIEEVATASAMSRRRLEYRFRAVLGCSPAEHIRHLRIEHAKDLLRRTQLPMPTIASKCGFSSASQFSTTFKHLTTLAPTAYRRAQKTTSGIDSEKPMNRS